MQKRIISILVAFAAVVVPLSVLAGGNEKVASQPAGGQESPTGEIGANDFRISFTGPNGDTSYGVDQAYAAFNTVENEYLVVWAATANVINKYEIMGQRLDASTGSPIGSNYVIATMGPANDPTYNAWDTAITYNPDANEYLVLFSGDTNTPPYVDEDYEVYGIRLNGSTGAPLAAMFRISSTGTPGTGIILAGGPDAVYNSLHHEYMVVWHSDHVNDEEFEIFGQRLDDEGNLLGVNFRISEAGPVNDSDYDAVLPDLAYDSVNDRYLVVWRAEGTNGAMVDNETEIFGQLLNGSGTKIFADGFRISEMGIDGDPATDAERPAVAFNPVSKQYFVVWEGRNTTSEPINVYGQRLDVAGNHVGADDFQITFFDGVARWTDLVYNTHDNAFMVVFYGETSQPPLVGGEREIYIQQLDASGQPFGPTPVRISDMGGDGQAAYDGNFSSAAYNSTANQYLLLWMGDDNILPLVDNEMEIFGQRYKPDLSAGLPFQIFLPIIQRGG